jgi:hypothetical protein
MRRFPSLLVLVYFVHAVVAAILAILLWPLLLLDLITIKRT